MNQLQINLSISEIKSMSEKKFKGIVRTKINSSAFEYLMKKRGSKGIEICYTSLEMAEYLTPINNEITIEDKQNLYSIRNRMFEISSNFKSKTENKSLCYCGESENMKHIYECEHLNKEKPTVNYESVYNGNFKQQITVMRRFENNIETRKQLIEKRKLENKNSDHWIPDRDPLYFDSLLYGNG